MSTEPREKLQSLLEDFNSAMLVTRNPSGDLHSRPMMIAKVEEGGALWFATDRHSGKVDELAADPHVNIALQNGGRFVSLAGKATVSDDRSKIDELWKEDWRVWFPDGKDDPRLVLLKVNPDSGEYWDNGGVIQRFKYILEAGRAYFAGERPRPDDKEQHARVAL